MDGISVVGSVYDWRSAALLQQEVVPVRARFRGDMLSSAIDCGAAAAEDGLARSAVVILGEETVHHIN